MASYLCLLLMSEVGLVSMGVYTHTHTHNCRASRLGFIEKGRVKGRFRVAASVAKSDVIDYVLSSNVRWWSRVTF